NRATSGKRDFSIIMFHPLPSSTQDMATVGCLDGTAIPAGSPERPQYDRLHQSFRRKAYANGHRSLPPRYSGSANDEYAGSRTINQFPTTAFSALALVPAASD